MASNPPYLPLNEEEPESSRRETTAGVLGNEIIIEFFKQAKKHLTKEGKIFIITSSLSKEVDFKKLEYKAKRVSHKKLFFEELFVFDVSLEN